MNSVTVIIFAQLALEALPISSSSHIYLLSQYFGGVELPPGFDHFLHGPWGLVLAIFFFKEWKSRIWWFLPKSLMFNATYKRHNKKLNTIAYKLLLYTFVANIITGIMYFALNFFELKRFMIIGLCLTAISLLCLLFKKNEYEPLNIKKAAVLGLAQGLALFPGVSRFGLTYVVARMLNLSPRRAFQSSFLIEFPTCMAAVLKSMSDFYDFKHLITIPVFIIGMLASFFLLMLAYNIAMKKKFWVFGIYMFIPIVVLLKVLQK